MHVSTLRGRLLDGILLILTLHDSFLRKKNGKNRKMNLYLFAWLVGLYIIPQILKLYGGGLGYSKVDFWSFNLHLAIGISILKWHTRQKLMQQDWITFTYWLTKSELYACCCCYCLPPRVVRRTFVAAFLSWNIPPTVD